MYDDNKILNNGMIFDNKIATNYFLKLNKLSKGYEIFQNYKESIKKSAMTGNPLYFIFDKSEFKNDSYISIKKQLEEKFVALVCLAEKMGYKVKNKNRGTFVYEEYAEIRLNIDANYDEQNKANIIQLDKYIN